MPRIGDDFDDDVKIRMPFIFVIAIGLGKRINTLNIFLRSFVEKIKALSTDSDFCVCLGILRCEKDTVTWTTGKELLSVKNYCYENLTETEESSLAISLEELNSSLSRKRLLADANVYPTIVFLMDETCVINGWENEMSSILNNKWYKRATLVAVGLTETVDKLVLEKLTRDNGYVFYIGENEKLLTIIGRSMAENLIPGPKSISLACALEKNGVFINSDGQFELMVDYLSSDWVGDSGE